MCQTTYRILIVDDEATAREQIRTFLERGLAEFDSRADFEEAASVAEAIDKLDGDGAFDLVILDWLLHDPGSKTTKDHDGIVLLEWIRDRDLDTEVFMFTAHGSEELEEGVFGLGAYAYFDKPNVLREASKRQQGGRLGGREARRFLFHVRNCMERRRLRSGKDRVIRVVGELQRKMAGTHALEERLQEIVKCVRAINPLIHKAAIRIRVEGGHQRVAVWGGDDDVNVGETLSDDEGITGFVIRTKEFYYCPDTRNDKLFFQTWPPTKSELCYPVFDRRGEVLAVINLESKEVDAFSQEDIKAMDTLASVASLTIQDVALFREIFEMAAEINHSVYPTDLAFAQDVPQVEHYVHALRSVTVDQVRPLFEHVLKGALRLTNAEFGAIFLADQDKQVLRRIVDRGMADEFKKDTATIPFDHRRSVPAEVFRTNRSLLATGQREKEKDLWEQYLGFFDQGAESAGSFLCVPMLLGEKAMAVIDIESQQGFEFSPLEKQVVEAYAAMAASALANLALLVSIRDRIVEETRSNLISLAVHEVAGPLHAVGLEIERCELLLEHGNNEVLASGLKTAGEKIQAASEEVRSLLKLATEPHRFDLLALLENEVQHARTQYPDYLTEMADVSSDASITVSANPSAVRFVARQLISNAVKHNTKDKVGVLRVEIEHSEQRVDVYFEDNGPGIPSTKLKDLFGSPGDPKKGGFGLHKCKGMIRLSGGDLELHANSTDGAVFRLWMPIVK